MFEVGEKYKTRTPGVVVLITNVSAETSFPIWGIFLSGGDAGRIGAWTAQGRFWVGRDDPNDLIELEQAVESTQTAVMTTTSESIVKCECGSVACGSSAHSTWCPVYE